MIIGITGGIGSGKSTVAGFFEKWGASVIDVDKLGWRVLEEKQQEIKKVFGDKVFQDSSSRPSRLDRARRGPRNGRIDRKKLGKIVFENPEKKKIFDSIIHPLLIKKLRKQLLTLNSQLSTPVVVDCALIYEWRINNWFDKIILVTSDYKKKLQRLMDSGYTQKEAEDRIHSQLPDSEKKKTADWIIENNSNLRTLGQNAKRIWDSIVNRKS